MEWAVDRRDVAAAQEIHERFKRDLLNEPPVERCGFNMDTLGVVGICVEAIESMAADALAASEALPGRVLNQLEHRFWRTYYAINLPERVRSEAEVAEMLAVPGARAQLIEYYSQWPEYAEFSKDEVEFAKFLRGDPGQVERLEHDAFLVEALNLEPWGPRKTAQAARLKAVLENHPEPMRTSEHYLALAAFPSTWRERIALLRDAVEVDPGHIGARCELAQTLQATGDLPGARREYHELLAHGERPCDAQASLEALDNRAPTEAVSLDDPHGVMVLH